jgi:hypothetical protein
MANRRLQGDDPERDLPAALEGVREVYTTHGRVLRALADAAPTDARVEDAYRGLVQAFIDATAEHIRSEQAARRTPRDLDAQETARPLVWLNERYLSEAFGHGPQDDPARVIGVLSHIWLATLYRQTGGLDRDASA